jgi:hypothetical protein
MGKRTFLKPRPNARVFKNSCPRIERRNFSAVKTGSFRVLGFCQKGQKSSYDLNATILHLLGIDHTRLTYKFQGRDFRLTDRARPGCPGDPGLSE